MTPNQITWAGCLFGVAAGACLFLASFHRAWFLVSIANLFLYWLADNLDGEVARGRSLVSERGYFLDMALDSVAFIAIFVGIAFSSYAQFRVIIFAPILYLLHDQLISLWIHLRDRHVFANTGPTEALLALITMALLSFVWSGPLFSVDGLPLGWFDLGFIAMQAWGLVELLLSAWRLYHLLD